MEKVEVGILYMSLEGPETKMARSSMFINDQIPCGRAETNPSRNNLVLITLPCRTPSN